MAFLHTLETLRTPLLDKLTAALTNIGGEYVFLVIAIAVFWCVSKKCGYYIMTVGFAGILASQFLKIAFRIPRPWVLDKDFTIVEAARAEATGYSFPSGHTLNAFAAAGAPAWYSRRRWACCLGAALVLITAFSRMYLGVHTPMDVGVGLVIGLVLTLTLRGVFENTDERPGAVYALYIGFIVLAAAFVLYAQLWPFPASVDVENYTSALENAYKLLFCGLGLLLSFYCDRRYTNFETRAVWWAQGIKLVIGLAVVLGLKSLLKDPLIALCGGHAVAQGLRYFLIVLFAGVLWPLTFKWFSSLGKGGKKG